MSSEPAIAVRGVSKSYRIGHLAQATTLAERFVQAVRHPFARDDRETLWALKDCSFDVARGDLVGIIGRNGAGKSTLLKLLSRITEPTTGEILMYGRVGALLEVGTGFHPELTGRENVYLNGTILGMRRREVAERFDEIVDFAEVERFLDTPVKHYSSGMYVRLAFAVAAHLEPEILIVDEVLAVGDSEFQRKCLGKMEEVAHAGRTVLFVSHNMQAIAALTRRTLVLDRGACVFDGSTVEGIAHYRAMQGAHAAAGAYGAAPGTKGNHVAAAHVVTSDPGGVQRCGQAIAFEFVLDVPEPASALTFSFEVVDADERPVCQLWCFDRDARFRHEAGRYTLRFDVPSFRAYKGQYTLRTAFYDRRTYDEVEMLAQLCPFEVTMDGIERQDWDWDDGARAYLEDHRWTLAREGSADGPQRGGFLFR
ncbi:MAG: ABC transporter ATP-binding protein [Gemmatimonadaceae bacterium]